MFFVHFNVCDSMDLMRIIKLWIPCLYGNFILVIYKKKFNLNKQMNECTIKFNINNSAETIIFTPAHIKSEIKTKI